MTWRCSKAVQNPHCLEMCRGAAASQGGLAQAAAAAVPSAAGAPPAEEYIEVGIIRSAHGLRGEMKVESLTSTPKERLGCPGPRCRPNACLRKGTQRHAATIGVQVHARELTAWPRSVVCVVPCCTWSPLQSDAWRMDEAGGAV